MEIDFDSIASYYDAMYVRAPAYKEEAEKIAKICQSLCASGGRSLLDIACGTGAHSLYLSDCFDVTGMDLSEEMLKIARAKAPAAAFIKGDMFRFHLEEQFDAAVNLYGSIGFAKNGEELTAGLQCAYNSLKRGGVFILTPWSTAQTFQEGVISGSMRQGDLHYCRMEAVRKLDAKTACVEMFHLIGQRGHIEQKKHLQRITLWSEEEYRSALASVGFRLKERLSEHEFRMGAFVCVKSL